MSEDPGRSDLKKKSSGKAESSTFALIMVLMVEFIMFAFYPFVFLVIVPHSGYIDYPENYYDYRDGKIAVLNKDISVESYVNWETDERGDGSNKIFIPAGSSIEVKTVRMNGYPQKSARISTCFYYDESGTGYTLWDSISFKSIEHPEEITADLDALREEEYQNNKDVLIREWTGRLITLLSAGAAVFLVCLIFKKNLTRHVLFASILVMVVFVLLFVLGPIGSNLYHANMRI